MEKVEEDRRTLSLGSSVVFPHPDWTSIMIDTPAVDVDEVESRKSLLRAARLCAHPPEGGVNRAPLFHDMFSPNRKAPESSVT